MNGLLLRQFHEKRSARFFDLNGQEAALDYGDWRREYKALRESAALVDLSFRGRLCAIGPDAQKFLNGQVTNNVKDLKVGHGCYAALVSAKGKMQSDLNIYRLENECLLDFEPGLSAAVKERLEKFVIAEEVEILDVAPLYGLLRVQGPSAGAAIGGMAMEIPTAPMEVKAVQSETFGELYLVFRPGPPAPAYDFFAPVESLERLAQALFAATGALCGWQALETVRIESTVPRFGADIDETNLPPEAGLENRAISYSKGCYIGQEVIARIRTYGQVARALRGLKLGSGAGRSPGKGAKLFLNGKEVGYITSVAESPRCQSSIALGYVRKEANAVGTELLVECGDGSIPARIETIPFQAF
jgi:folate-binding protein YgfZ